MGDEIGWVISQISTMRMGSPSRFTSDGDGYAWTARIGQCQDRQASTDIMRYLERARRDTRSVGERDSAGLSIAATHALSFTFFPGWIRAQLQLEAFGALSLISDSMEGCEQILLSGEVHFLLCHFHPAAPTRFA